MTHSPPDRLLALVSSDWGELANTIDLLEGAALQTRLLLPPSLLAHNPDMGTHAVAPFGRVEDLLDTLETFRPRLLLLASAYLFGLNRLMTLAELATVLDTARRLKVRVATTDPFLGQWIDLRPTGQRPEPADEAQDLRQVAALLTEALHLYPVPVAPVTGRQGWFNARSLRDAEGLRTLAAGLGTPAGSFDAPFWLLVLSAPDFHLQCRLQGRAGFEGALLALAEAAARQGRRLVGLVPSMACESLQAMDRSGALWQGYCGHARFQALALCAEHAFYWNPLSNSVRARLANGRSVFCLDTGHMARAMPALYAAACRAYFADAPPPLLDKRDLPASLGLTELAAQAQAHWHALAPMRQALLQLPSGAEVLDHWMQGESTL